MFFVAQSLSKFLFFLILHVSTMYAAVPNSLIGKWKGEDKPNNHTEFFVAKDGFYYGKLIYEGVETKNLGNLIFKKVKFNSAKNNYQGKMCPPDANLEIDATISFITPNKLKIVLKKLLLSKTIYFVRIQ
jgi:hypothetical protein